MADITAHNEAKSDQLNAADIMAGPRTITVRAVNVPGGEQPVHVFFDGDNNRPWKPCKGMLRVLAKGWTKESDNWIGKRAELYFEPTVTYGGQEVGGIRIRAMSDIPARGLQVSLTLNRQKRIPFRVECLKPVERAPWPDDKFATRMPGIRKALSEGTSLQEIIAKLETKGTLTPAQIQQLETAAPVDIEGDEA